MKATEIIKISTEMVQRKFYCIVTAWIRMQRKISKKNS